jgi:hypothetical protein
MVYSMAKSSSFPKHGHAHTIFIKLSRSTALTCPRATTLNLLPFWTDRTASGVGLTTIAA